MPFSLSLSPPKTQLNLNPGQPASKAYDLINDSDSPQTLELQVLPWQPVGYDGSFKFSSSPSPFNFYINNADLQGKSTFTIGANQKQQIVLGLSTPDSTPSGDYYFTVFFSQINPLNPQTNSSQSSGQIGSNLLIHLGRSEAKALTINRFGLPSLVDTFFSPLNITGLAQNPTNSFFNFVGYLELEHKGKIIHQIALAGDTILAGHARFLRCIDNPESEEPKVTPCQIPKALSPGLYTLSLHSSADIQLSGTTSQTFFIFPFYLSLLFFTIAIISSLAYLFFKSHKK